MAKSYSDDLRRKLLEAHQAGKGTLSQLSESFGVSARWAWKVSSDYRRTGSMAQIPQRRRRPADTAVDALLGVLVADRPDIVLRELQAELKAGGRSISIPHLWRTLRRLGLRLKKSRSMPPSATRKPTSSGVRTSSASSPRLRPKT